MAQSKLKNEQGETIKAGCLVYDGGRVLLVKNRGAKYWSYPKGHAEAGEALDEVAKREVNEETGYKVEIAKRLPDLRYTRKDEVVRLAMFLARPIGAQGQPEEQSDWFSIKEAQKVLRPDIAFLLDEI